MTLLGQRNTAAADLTVLTTTNRRKNRRRRRFKRRRTMMSRRRNGLDRVSGVLSLSPSCISWLDLYEFCKSYLDANSPKISVSKISGLPSFDPGWNWKSAPPKASPNQKRRRANTQGDVCAHTDPTSAEDTANDSSDLVELDTEDEEVQDEEEVTGEEEEEEEGEGNEERNEEDEPVSNDDMEQSRLKPELELELKFEFGLETEREEVRSEERII
ncbi:hypothetical protein BDD12DRAFT_884610 [Trichophaea hybrida]|nr:hypothetical protein BDD12DRAFT_884610 [Trichophaea hybrida]